MYAIYRQTLIDFLKKLHRPSLHKNLDKMSHPLSQ